MTHRTATIIGGLGRTLIALGLVVLMFAGFQLWGTGILEAQAQEALANEWDDKLAELEALEATFDDNRAAEADTPGADETLAEADAADAAAAEDSDAAIDPGDNPVLGAPAETDDVDAAPLPDAVPVAYDELIVPAPGEVLGTIEIEKIKMERNIIAGVRRGDLRKGPGHYPDTPLPGQAGNAAIAGHRTTYGQPFHDLDLLVPGDIITVNTLQGQHFYEVMAHTNEDGEEVGHFIVHPSEVGVLDDFGDNRLTLTACHPKRSSRLRLIVTARLVSEPQRTTARPAQVFTQPVDDLSEVASEGEESDELADEPIEEYAFDDESAVGIDENALEESLGWNTEEVNPTLLWGGLAVALAIFASVLAHYWRKWTTYALTAPLFLFLLFFTFVHLDRLLPAL